MATDTEKLVQVRAWLKAHETSVAALGALLGTAAVPAAPKSRILVPLYAFPDDARRATTWTAVAKLGKSVIAIVNPEDGDFSAVSTSYVKAIAQLDAGGVEWVGYVSTDYGKRPLADVVNDIQTWPKIYPTCRGYFLDEQASGWMPIYTQIVAACRAAIPSGLVISNPGLTGCDARYLTIADVLVMTEHANGVPTLPDWARAARDDKIAILAHGVMDEATMRAVVTKAKANGYGLIYVTDRTLGNSLWGGLPSYWPALVAAVTA